MVRHISCVDRCETGERHISCVDSCVTVLIDILPMMPAEKNCGDRHITRDDGCGTVVISHFTCGYKCGNIVRDI